MTLLHSCEECKGHRPMNLLSSFQPPSSAWRAVNVDTETINRFYSLCLKVIDSLLPWLHPFSKIDHQEQTAWRRTTITAFDIYVVQPLFFFLSFKAAYTRGPAWSLNPSLCFFFLSFKAAYTRGPAWSLNP